MVLLATEPCCGRPATFEACGAFARPLNESFHLPPPRCNPRLSTWRLSGPAAAGHLGYRLRRCHVDGEGSELKMIFSDVGTIE
jgi:hypothetical protein